MLKELYETTSTKEIQEKILKDLKDKELTLNYVYNRYLPFLWQTDNSLYTVRNRYQDLRKLIEDSRLSKAKKEEALLTFSISKELTEYLNNKSSDSASEKINNKKSFKFDDYEACVSELKELINNKNISHLRVNRQDDDYILANVSAVYVAFVTGRRMFEIAKTLEVSKRGNTVYYKGLLKKRNDEEDAEYIAYLIDEDYLVLKKAVANIRKYYSEKFESMSNAQFNSSYQKTWNSMIKQILPNFEDITYSKVRDMYSDVAIKKYLAKGEDAELLRAKVLSHKTDRLDKTSRYRKTKGE